MSYVGAAANIVGGELQGWASVLEKKNMFEEFQKEMARQQQYRDQGAQLFQGFVNQASPTAAAGELKSGAAAREKSYADVGAVPLAPVTGSMRQPTARASRDRATMDMRGQARARLGAYSDWQLQQTLDNIQNQEALQQLSSFAKGTAGVFPYKMYKAQHSLDDLAMAGAAISSIGGGAANYAQYSQQPTISNNQLYAPYYSGTTDPYTGGPMNSYLGAGLALG